jgi:hypothetical protein
VSELNRFPSHIAALIGFFFGDRRGVKQWNAILDDNLKTLLKGMLESGPIPAESLPGEEQPAR